MRDEDPVGKSEETREELVKRLREEIRQDEEERKEEQKQKEYEDSQKMVHWTKKRKKPGKKRTEKDEGLFLRFPDGQVSRDLNHSQCILILLAPQSGAHTIAPHRDPIQPIQPIQSHL